MPPVIGTQKLTAHFSGVDCRERDDSELITAARFRTSAAADAAARLSPVRGENGPALALGTVCMSTESRLSHSSESIWVSSSCRPSERMM